MRKTQIAMMAVLGLVGSSAALAQSAPPLTSVTIRSVSSSAGSESVSPSQTTTAINHSSTNGRVVIREIGYGSNRFVRMAGTQISPGNQVSTTSLCGSTSNPTTCSSGQTIIGFDVTYSFAGYASGLFEYRATSINAPQNTYSDSIQIQ